MSDLSTYIARGWSLHPLPPNEKRSRTKWAEFQQRRRDEAAIFKALYEEQEEWARRHPGEDGPPPNLALVTGAISGVVVVDVDPVHGGDPAPFLGTSGLVARTRSGGWHFYYRHPGAKVASVAGVNPALPGIDVRGDGGYVVVPPSSIDGKSYAWEAFGEPGDWARVTPILYQAADDDKEEVTFEAAGGNWLSDALLKGVAPGEQRQALTRLAGYLASKNVPADVAYGLLLKHASSWPQKAGEPWKPRHIQGLVDSIYESHARRSVADVDPTEPTSAHDAATPAGGPSPSGVADVRALVGDTVHEFVRKYARQVTDWCVEEWLPDQTIGMLSSPPGGYKTWMLLDLALSVAMGKPFLDRYPVHRPGPVIFIQQEDPRPLLANRVGPLEIGKLYQGKSLTPEELEWFAAPTDTPLYLVTDGSFSFSSKDAKLALLRRIEEVRPRLIILDPLYAMTTLGNFMQEMPHEIGWLKRVRDKYGCSFLIAHHTKKLNQQLGDAGREQMWGSNLMNAALECSWQIRPAGATATTITRFFKSSGTKSVRRFEFAIDLESITPFIVTESDLDDPAVDESEKAGTPKGTDEAPKIETEHQLILAYVRNAKEPVGVRAMAEAVGVDKSKVGRLLATLVKRGLLSRTKDKKYVPTEVDPKEVV